MTDDFSVLYVATNSNPNLPIYYKFAALWGGHEGSLLLFLLILAGWILVFVLFNEDQKYSSAFMNIVLFVCFYGFSFQSIRKVAAHFFNIWFGSQPIASRFCLYNSSSNALHGIRWISYSIRYSYEFSLNQEKVKQLEPIRSWSLVSWSFLTLEFLRQLVGLHELGWGGWWDPVENSQMASWLLCTALIHSSIAPARQFYQLDSCSHNPLASRQPIGMFLVRSHITSFTHLHWILTEVFFCYNLFCDSYSWIFFFF